jgi:hypothetical protein
LILAGDPSAFFCSLSIASNYAAWRVAFTGIYVCLW